MELRLLEYFMAVCQELHFTRAAEKLGINQSTLSIQIRLLENRVGTPLFNRIGKKVYVTQAGKYLLEHSERVFYELDQAKNKIKELKGLQRGKLVIGSIGYHILKLPIISFHEQYPGIELSVLDLSTEETINGILHNQLDLGVTFISPQNEHLESIPLFKEGFRLVVSVNHKLAKSTSISFSRLQSIDHFALLPKKYIIRQILDKDCQEAGFTLHPKIEISSLEALHEMARLNKVATMLPKSYLLGIDDPEIRLISFDDPPPQKTVGVIYRKDSFMDTSMSALIKHLVEAYKHGNNQK